MYGFEWDLNGGTLIFFEARSRYPSFARSEELYSRSRERTKICIVLTYKRCVIIWSLLYYVCVHVPREELIVGIGWFYARLKDFLIGT